MKTDLVNLMKSQDREVSELLICTYISSYTICEAEVNPHPLLLGSSIDLLYQPWMRDGDDCGAISGMNK
jgi:hypothetical protein